MVSRTGKARIAAPSRRAAATTRATALARISGRAASWITTSEASPGSAASPARTESCRSAPPTTGSASLGPARSADATRR
jgi:hypothetical protein